MFLPLQVQSAYSLLETPMALPAYVKKAKLLGYTAIGLADVNVLYGALEFHRACRAEGLQAFFGLTLRLPSLVAGQAYDELLLYAKNQAGYKALLLLSSLVKLQEEVDREEILETLFAEARNLLVILPMERGTHMAYLKERNAEGALHWLAHFKKQFAKPIYLGVTSAPYWSYYWKDIERLGKTLDLPRIPLPSIQYLEPGEAFTQRVLEAIQTREIFREPATEAKWPGQAYLRSPAYYEESFAALPVTLTWPFENWQKQYQVVLKEHQELLPGYPVPHEESAADYLTNLAKEGLAERGLANEKAYNERLTYELKVIIQMGFADYFLLVWDVMRYAREAGIMTGPGRGSAAGSLVAYALQITQIDPVHYGLLFERFLNPERQNMPDIDLDFPDNRRNDILNYVYQKYGARHVAQIATFGTFAARMALRDVGSVLGQTQRQLKAWSNTVGLNQTLTEVWETSGKLQSYVHENKLGRLWLKTAEAIEGLPRHVSTHAAGVIIADQDLLQFLPLQKSSHGPIPLSQFTMGDVEALGLLKVDFLSLSNLTILARAQAAVDHLEKRHVSITRGDAATFKIFQAADTLGVFQFESAGIRQVLEQVAPKNLEELAAVNALYRPGPMKQIPHYVNRKFQREPITYPHADLQPILEETYGIMVYQEQVMRVAQRFAGFTLGEADILRRAISKKQQDLLQRMREKFYQGAKDRGYSKASAEEIFRYIEAFADYGFNKSHAFAYAALAYDLAWYKAHYPAAFYLANLRQVKLYDKKGQELLSEARQRQVEVLPPDINTSYQNMHLVGPQTIRLGLSDIKGLPQFVFADILHAREQIGRFKDIYALIQQLGSKSQRQEILEALAWSGALDTLGETRRTLIEEAIPKYLAHVSLFGQETNAQTKLALSGLDEQAELFQPVIIEKPEYDDQKLLAGEMETLGQGLTVTLYKDYQPYYETGQLTPSTGIKAKKTYALLGKIIEVKTILTKRNQDMAFIVLQDQYGQLDVTVFPEIFIRYSYLLREGEQVFVRGQSQWRDGRWQLIAKVIVPLNEQVRENLEKTRSKKATKPQAIYIQVKNKNFAAQQWPALKKLCQRAPGSVRLYFSFREEEALMPLPQAYQLAWSDQVGQSLRELFGEKNVIYQKD